MQVVILSYVIAVILGGAGVLMIFLSNMGAFNVFLGICTLLLVGAILLKRIKMEDDQSESVSLAPGKE